MFSEPTGRNHGTDALFIGGDILNLITSGMYASPLAIYREYIQNAVDAIALSDRPKRGKIEINIEPAELRITIRDNGPGLSYKQAKRELIPISRSYKHRQYSRGFRGIGRLSGLAFGSSVTFLTCTRGSSLFTRVTWDRDKLRKEIDGKCPVGEIISKCVTVDQLKGSNTSSGFFEVRIDGVSRHAAAFVLNRDSVRRYIGEVCPVPFEAGFPYASRISKLFQRNRTFLTLNVYLDGEKTPVTRPHKKEAYLPGNRFDRFTGYEEIKIPKLEGRGFAAVGWIAHTSYIGALRKESGIRCIRVRAGNIQIGDESVFDHLFSETRFNRWCVAELHILDPRVIPNGRRDYFEPSPHLRNIENHLGAICRKLERRCRTESVRRNQHKRFQLLLESLDASYSLARSGYLTTNAAKKLIGAKLSSIEDLKEKHQSLNHTEDLAELNVLEDKLLNFRVKRGRASLAGIDASEVPVYRTIFGALTEILPSLKMAKETMEKVLARTRK